MKSVKYFPLHPLLVPALLALAAGTASAAVVTDGFDGGLSNWGSSGDVAIQNNGGNNFVVLTSAFAGTSDDPTAMNVSGTNPSGAGGTLESFLGIAVGALDLDAINQATEGSALTRTFTVNAGDVLSFDWQLATRETVGQDYAFLTIGGQLVTLGSVSAALQPGTAPYLTQTGTGLAHYEHVFTTGGQVTIGFGVVDVGDFSTTTSLVLDNVSVVPEPSAALLGGMAALTLFRRRKR